MSQSTPPPTIAIATPNQPLKKTPLEFKLKVMNGMVEDMDQIAHDCYMARKKVDMLMQQWYTAKTDLDQWCDTHKKKPYYQDLKMQRDCLIFDDCHFYKKGVKRTLSGAFVLPPTQ